MKSGLPRSLSLGICLLAAVPMLHARGVSPYLPLNLDPELEREVERVLILGDRPVMTRPIPAAAVIDALPKACAVDPVLCGRVRRALKAYMHDSALQFASIEGSAVNGDSKLVIPNQHGQTEQSQWQIAGAGHLQPSNYFLLNLGGVAYDGRQKPTGSFVSVGFEGAQLDIGFRDHWWSPLTDSAMMISTEAPTMPSVTLSNYTPLTRLGWSYEVFVARMSHTDKIELTNGELTAGNPKYSGVRLGIAPANSGWSFAGNRIVVFGGGAAGGQSLSQILRAFFNPIQAQTQTTSSGKPVLGKQQASLTSRFNYPGRIPFSLYFEFAGNDTGGGNRLTFSRTNLSVGLQFPRLGPFDLTYEISEWQPSWYVKGHTDVQYGYGDGITNYLINIGHWFGDQRQFGDAIGGQSNMLRLGYEPHFGGRFELTLRSLVNDSYYSAVLYEHEYMGSLMYSYPLRDYVIGTQVDHGRDVFGEHYTRVTAFLRYGDALHSTEGEEEDSAPAGRPEGIEVHVDLGAVGSNVLANITSDTPQVSSGVGFGPHLTIGARRAASAHQDLGAALEADGVHGVSLLSARILDYRYRFDNPLALNVFLGAARYAQLTPAYGFYYGAGLQWRNILPHWDVGIDLRYASKVDRIRSLPGEPQGGYRPDAYYNITLGTLYVSRKF
jgi:hypothetical protein